jgi:hypothetical protein
MKTVLVTINTPGSETGPNFDIFSNVDLVTPLVSSVTKTSLISGYSVTTVPDAATSIRVKSIPGTCSTYVDLSIVTPTTTTTTVACTTVEYGYGEDQASACAAYIDFPEIFQYNGTTLFLDNPGSLCGAGSTVAGQGYYSNGADVYYWDGTTLTFSDVCGLFSLETITIFAKRGAGTISSGNNYVDVLYSTDAGNTWTSAWTAITHALSTTYANVASFQVFTGTEVLIGMYSPYTYDMAFTETDGSFVTDNRAGLCSPFNYGIVNFSGIVYLQAPVFSSSYKLGVCP